MKAIIETAFPICTVNGCVKQPEEAVIYIQDQKESQCIVITDPALAHFIVNNPDVKTLTFIAIDHCIWGNDSGHKKCDFAISDNATFAFIEIKDTTTRSNSHKIKAKAQLEETIKKFNNQIDLTHLLRKAVICWKYGTTHPAAKTEMQSALVHFWDTYQVALLEGNSISF